MAKLLLYPVGYCPATAAGPPSEGYKSMGITWTEEETKRHKELEKQAVVIDSSERPYERWCRELSDEEAAQHRHGSLPDKESHQ